MFQLSIGHLLETYSGDNQTLEFEGEIPENLYEDIKVIGNLTFTLTLIATDDGIETIVKGFHGIVLYEGEEFEVEIPEFDRTWKKEFDPNLPDDICFINMKHAEIDLTPVIREEILMNIL